MSFRPLLGSTLCYGLTLAGLVASLASIGCGRADSLPPEDSSLLTIQLRSSAFDDGGMIPKVFSCDGSDSSPPFEWSGIPPAARSLALIVDDPDSPIDTWSHWVVFNLPPQVTAIKQAVPPEQIIEPAYLENLGLSNEQKLMVVQGGNDFGKTGYGGPCPPSGTHRYSFRLYALDNELQLNPTATRADVLKQISGHILAEGRLVGKYTRSRAQ
jgi:Raf kinase inhibitor-like YbhB/YbcL family protein